MTHAWQKPADVALAEAQARDLAARNKIIADREAIEDFERRQNEPAKARSPWREGAKAAQQAEMQRQFHQQTLDDVPRDTRPRYRGWAVMLRMTDAAYERLRQKTPELADVVETGRRVEAIRAAKVVDMKEAAKTLALHRDFVRVAERSWGHKIKSDGTARS